MGDNEILMKLASHPHIPVVASVVKGCAENSEHSGRVVLPKHGHSLKKTRAPRIDIKHPVESKFCRTCAALLTRKVYKKQLENYQSFLRRKYCSCHCAMVYRMKHVSVCGDKNEPRTN